MRTRLLSSSAVLLLVVIGAALIRLSPGPNVIDDWGFRLLPLDRYSSWQLVADVGTLPVVVAVVALAALVCLPRDRWRSLACLVGPGLAGLLTQVILKPMSGRVLGVGLSFPSGHVTGASALVTVVVLVAPRRWRPPVLVVGAVIVAGVMSAVVSLGWHYPTDALAGAAVGSGSVVFVDAALHAITARTGPVKGEGRCHRAAPLAESSTVSSLG